MSPKAATLGLIMAHIGQIQIFQEDEGCQSSSDIAVFLI